MQSPRPHNRRIVLETIRRSGPLSRTDLARLTGLTSQTVGNLVVLLGSQGLVVEVERTPDAHYPGVRGQPSRPLVLNPRGALAAGFHLDRDGWEAAVCDLTGARIYHEAHRPGPGFDPAWIEAQWAGAWARMQQALGPARGPDRAAWAGAGAAGPGPFAAPGVLAAPPHFPGWEGVDLGALVARVTGLRAWVENDARAAAAGEVLGGRGREYDDFVYLYYSLGLGLGVVAGGELWAGSRGRGGEWGSGMVSPGGLESLVSRQAPGDLETQVGHLAPYLEAVGLALDTGAIVVGGALSPADRELWARALAPRLGGLPVVAGTAEGAAAAGAAALAVTRSCAEW